MFSCQKRHWFYIVCKLRLLYSLYLVNKDIRERCYCLSNWFSTTIHHHSKYRMNLFSVLNRCIKEKKFSWVTVKKQLGTIWGKNVLYQFVLNLIFLAIFFPLIGHIARYTPSSSEENISKIWGSNHTNLFFHRHLTSTEGDKRGPSFLTERQYLVDELTRLWLARHVQNLSRISPMRRIFSFTDFYCVLLDLYAPAGRYGLSRIISCWRLSSAV